MQIKEPVDNFEGFTATYSPEDNKLRLYADARLDEDTYQMVRDAGFRWAPKQNLFVAPAWSPKRENVLIRLCGEIGDEETSLADRQQERAERFAGYQGNRLQDAEAAHDAVVAITDNIPFGQPILVGHHSEKRALKDAQRIENGMARAVKMWDTSEYWKDRAAGAIRHGQYKENPQVRARRIKKIQAEKRKYEKYIRQAAADQSAWEAVADYKQAWNTANFTSISKKFMKADYPKSNYEGSQSLWSALNDNIITWEHARELALSVYPRDMKYNQRWVDHAARRLDYEKALLEGQGASDLLEPKARPKQLPLLNYRAAEGIETESRWSRESTNFPQKEMTKAEYSKIYSENRYCLTVDGSHRVRFYSSYRSGVLDRHVVFLTDSKTHEVPNE